jgi:hypothetical protein
MYRARRARSPKHGHGQRNLTNIRFVTASLLDLPTLSLGSFDYIDCCGVLHHLPDPAAGLAILAGALKDDGGIGLMVYGALGRIGVYHLQGILRQLAADEPDSARLDLARRLLKQLPASNWFARNPFLGDHLNVGDAGVYDLLLHSQDRAYTIPELTELVGSAGLAITGLIEPWRYEPTSYLTDGALLKRVASLGWLERARMAESLAGNLKVHICYIVKADRAATAVAQPHDPAMIPVLREGSGIDSAKDLRPGGALTARARRGGGALRPAETRRPDPGAHRRPPHAGRHSCRSFLARRRAFGVARIQGGVRSGVRSFQCREQDVSFA